MNPDRLATLLGTLATVATAIQQNPGVFGARASQVAGGVAIIAACLFAYVTNKPAPKSPASPVVQFTPDVVPVEQFPQLRAALDPRGVDIPPFVPAPAPPSVSGTTKQEAQS